MKPVYINFLTIKKKSTKKIVVMMLACLICAVCFTVWNFYTFFIQKKMVEHYKIKIETIVSKNKKKNQLPPAEAEQLKSDVDFLNTLLKDKNFPWIDMLDRLETSIDEGVRFTQIEIDREQKKILLQGKADSAQNLSRFIKNISSDKLFILSSLSQESRQNSEMYFDMGIILKQ